ncbi:MAG TPA: alpha/beta hydrolase-fold protein [Cryomorphaceae bacterium]|nr:alpha/beta hydrolase-fold protein [Cryomorphaceae bacterium]
MSRYAPVIEIIEDNYEIPQLGRKRRISALLPFDYYQSEKAYPILILKDGQNLFDEAAPFGNWAIDQELEKMAAHGHSDLIVIAIDHGGEDRITEYLPYFNPKYGKGEGELYLKFIEDTLIPYVHKKYRTKKGREHLGIGGSSMGGLISLFAGLNHQETFGKFMVFSPSLWIAPKIFQQAENYRPELKSKFYIYAGGKESANHMPNVLRFEKTLLNRATKHQNIELKLSVNPDGEHSERFWRAEFPGAVNWLYF